MVDLSGKTQNELKQLNETSASLFVILCRGSGVIVPCEGQVGCALSAGSGVI